jgi:hypothetical protein
VPVTVGFALTVISWVAIQLLLFVYVIVAVPVATPVTTPEFVTDATAVLEETQGFELAAVALPVKFIVEPTQTGLFPVIVGFEFTVTAAVI